MEWINNSLESLAVETLARHLGKIHCQRVFDLCRPSQLIHKWQKPLSSPLTYHPL